MDREVMEASLAILEFVMIQGTVYVGGYHVVDRFDLPSEGGVQRVRKPIECVFQVRGNSNRQPEEDAVRCFMNWITCLWRNWG